ncbi:MAG: hypothetical protein HY471_00185 [Candidatus Sungbacteria bacterium]|nr:hypothetical protein [Candidatus Sungbacteria bacterium]
MKHCWGLAVLVTLLASTLVASAAVADETKVVQAASVNTAPIERWQGTWYYQGRSGSLDVNFAPTEKAPAGTITATNVTNTFGDDPVPLENVTLAEDQLRFTAVGADGAPLIASGLKIKNGRAKGWVKHGGVAVQFDLKRVN